MIKLISVESRSADEEKITATLFADTKEEVPATGALTEPDGMSDDVALDAASILYTASLEVAVLDSSDNWHWS